MLNLYLLKRKESDWDEMEGIVVRAGSEEGARRIAMKNSYCEPESEWKDPEKSTCRKIGTANEEDDEPMAILRSVING